MAVLKPNQMADGQPLTSVVYFFPVANCNFDSTYVCDESYVTSFIRYQTVCDTQNVWFSNYQYVNDLIVISYSENPGDLITMELVTIVPFLTKTTTA